MDPPLEEEAKTRALLWTWMLEECSDDKLLPTRRRMSDDRRFVILDTLDEEEGNGEAYEHQDANTGGGKLPSQNDDAKYDPTFNPKGGGNCNTSH